MFQYIEIHFYIEENTPQEQQITEDFNSYRFSSGQVPGWYLYIKLADENGENGTYGTVKEVQNSERNYVP